MSGAVPAAGAAAAPRIWDLPTRLFHWALVSLVVFSFVTAKIGGNAMAWHMRSGYAILTLLLFRLVWGFIGARYARFTTFVRGPGAVVAYVRGLRTPDDAGPAAAVAGPIASAQAGHSPLGALAVVAMLLVLLVQATTGLFANDEIFTEGPLAKLVSGETSARLTGIHLANQWVIVSLVALHLLAIAWYTFARRDNLVGAMIFGDKPGARAEPANDDVATRVRAAIALAICAGIVAWIVNR